MAFLSCLPRYLMLLLDQGREGILFFQGAHPLKETSFMLGEPGLELEEGAEPVRRACPGVLCEIDRWLMCSRTWAVLEVSLTVANLPRTGASEGAT